MNPAKTKHQNWLGDLLFIQKAMNEEAKLKKSGSVNWEDPYNDEDDGFMFSGLSALEAFSHQIGLQRDWGETLEDCRVKVSIRKERRPFRLLTLDNTDEIKFTNQSPTRLKDLSPKVRAALEFLECSLYPKT